MIRINLLGEKVDRSAVYALHGLAIGAAAVASLMVCAVVHGSMSSRLELANNQKSILEGQLTKLREKTKKVEALEKNKKLLSEKLTTIAKLKAKKTGPVHLLDDITGAIPERSWLTSIKHKSDGLEFAGVALDPQTVSTFMTQLSASKWIQSVDLSFSKQAMRQGVPIQEFALLVKIRNALEVNKPKDAGKTPRDRGKKEDASAAGKEAADGTAAAAPADEAAAKAPGESAPADPAATKPDDAFSQPPEATEEDLKAPSA